MLIKSFAQGLDILVQLRIEHSISVHRKRLLTLATNMRGFIPVINKAKRKK